MERFEQLNQQEELAWRFHRVQALIRAMYCVADHHARYHDEEPDELLHLAEIGKEYCQDAYDRTYKLRDIFAEWAEELREKNSPKPRKTGP